MTFLNRILEGVFPYTSFFMFVLFSSLFLFLCLGAAYLAVFVKCNIGGF